MTPIRLPARLALLTWLLVAASGGAAAQVALTFDAAEARGVSAQHLDSLYRPAHEILEGDALGDGWTAMFTEIGAMLKVDTVAFNEPLEPFFRIYFDSTGAIDYLLFHLRDEADAARLAPLLDRFVAGYRFPARAREPYVQCGSVAFDIRR